MREGRGYCAAHLPSLAKVRAGMSAIALSERLVREHRVAVIPGETFGVTRGCWLRIAYGSLREETAVEGIGRLVTGLRAILFP